MPIERQENLLRVKVNGRAVEVQVDPTWTLLRVLREKLGLTGTKKGCEQGDCGACTILLEGKAVNACLVMALQAEGKEIETIEGLGTPDRLHPLQKSFIQHGAVQCGFCTPGMVVSAKALLDRHPDPSEDQVREVLAGHFCRCTG
jgi:carbon-monoxide dehydrogenase small subunit